MFWVLFFSCNKGANYLYKVDNPELVKQLGSIKECQGMYQIIRENVLFDNQDSMFLINDGLWLYLKDYESCIGKINNKFINDFFGQPDTIINGRAFYICYKGSHPIFDEPFYGLGPWREASVAGNFMHFLPLHSRKMKYELARYWNLNSDSTLLENLREKYPVVGKSTGGRLISNRILKLSYTNSKSKQRMINMCELRFSGYLCNEDLAFTKSEMQNIFGKPDLISNDTLFYQTITSPFANISGRFPAYKGKVFCSIFVKNATGGFAYMNGLFVDPSRLN